MLGNVGGGTTQRSGCLKYILKYPPHYTKHNIRCHLLNGVTQCYFLLYKCKLLPGIDINAL